MFLQKVEQLNAKTPRNAEKITHFIGLMPFAVLTFSYNSPIQIRWKSAAKHLPRTNAFVLFAHIIVTGTKYRM